MEKNNNNMEVNDNHQLFSLVMNFSFWVNYPFKGISEMQDCYWRISYHSHKTILSVKSVQQRMLFHGLSEYSILIGWQVLIKLV